MKLRILLYCLLGGLPLTFAALGAGRFIWWWLSGILLAAGVVPIALFGPRGALGQLGVVAPVLLVVSVLCTWSEALIFLPRTTAHALRDLEGALVLYLIEAVVLAVLPGRLRLIRSSRVSVPRCPATTTVIMVLACGAAYAVYYLVFGAIAYQFSLRATIPRPPTSC